MPNSLLSVGKHLTSPFSIEEKFNGPKTISKTGKITSIVATIALGIFTLGIFALPAFYITTGIFKWRTISQIKSNPQAQQLLVNNQLPPIPAEGVKTGLPNSSLNCWWNTILKLLATTDTYESLFDANLSQYPAVETFKYQLKLMVARIRLGREGEVIPQTEFNNLLTSLEEALPFSSAYSHAIQINVRTANEFIELLQRVVNLLRHGEQSIELRTLPDHLKKCHIKTANIIYESGTSVPPATCRDVVLAPIYTCYDTNPQVLFDFKLENTARKNPGFQYQKICLSLPDRLIINAPNAERGTETIQTENGRIHLVEYSEATLEPAFDCYYEIQGVKPNIPGHAVYIEKTNNGEYIEHNDRRVQRVPANQAENNVSQADVFVLKLVERVPIQ